MSQPGLDLGALFAKMRAHAAGWGAVDPEDVAQEAAVRTLAKGELAEAARFFFRETEVPIRDWPLDRFIGYAMGIVRFVALDQRREQRTTQYPGAGGDLADVADETPGPLETLIQEERRRLLRDAIDALDPNEGQVLRLRMAGHTNEEIARALGISKGTVAVRLCRGLKRAARRLRERQSLAPQAKAQPGGRGRQRHG